MNVTLQKTLHQLTGYSSIADAGVDGLFQLTDSHPYFSIPHFFLTQKLQADKHVAYLPQLQKTALYFNNINWLHYQTIEHASAIKIVHKNSAIEIEETKPLLQHVIEEEIQNAVIQNTTQKQDEIAEVEPIIEQPIEQIANTITQQIILAETTTAGLELTHINEFVPLPTIVSSIEPIIEIEEPSTQQEQHHASIASIASIALEETESNNFSYVEQPEIVQKQNLEEKLVEATIEESAISNNTNIEEKVIEDEIKVDDVAPIEEPIVIKEPIFSGFSSIVATDINFESKEINIDIPSIQPIDITEKIEKIEPTPIPKIKPKAEPETKDFNSIEGFATANIESIFFDNDAPLTDNSIKNEELAETKITSILKGQLEEFKKPITEFSKLPIETEPYHTIDYFASQGIKPNYDQHDQLSKQLRRFTDWLKHMKNATPSDEDLGTDPELENAIQGIAQTSNEAKEIVTETMAEVLVKQGKLDKAIQLYIKLSFLNPDKSIYFATKIQQLKGI